MTSVPFNVGLNDSARLSSRVLRPPGGGHTDIFGGEPEPTRTGRRFGPQNASTTTLGNDDPKPTNGAEVPSQNGQASQEPVQEQKPVPEQKTVEVAAPEPKPETPKTETPIQVEQVRAEPPKRVRVPPGGFSSGLW